MTAFAVWAPRAQRVDLDLDRARVPMASCEGGWWRAEAPARPGTRYGFSLDSGPARPDPRSVAQPDGFDGLSAVYDHDAWTWNEGGWAGLRLPGAVLYELHLGTFSEAGTFDGAVERLDHLTQLGVDAVEVMPVATAPGRRGWGYDGVDLWAVHPAYGGPDAFKRFVEACHAQGLAVVLDVVYNHLGPLGNHLPEFGPYFTDRHQTPWGDAVNFDGPDAAEVRRFVVDNAAMWVRDFHVDGLRLDAVHAIVDESPRHIVADIADAVRAEGQRAGRAVVVIAESDANDPRLIREDGVDAVWADDWHHALHTVLTGESDGYYADYGGRDDLVKALEQAWVYDGRWSESRGRNHGAPPTGLRADNFVVATQNHDQIGNRARGDRLAALTSPGRLRIAAALLLTSPFVPLLFQGEEWAASSPFLYFTDHPDRELADAVREGRRREFAAFGWEPEQVPDPQADATFAQSRLAWDEPEAPAHRSMLGWYRALIELRRSRGDLRDPCVRVRAGFAADVLLATRGAVTVVANLGETVAEVAMAGAIQLAWQASGTAAGLRMDPDGVAVVIADA